MAKQSELDIRDLAIYQANLVNQFDNADMRIKQRANGVVSDTDFAVVDRFRHFNSTGADQAVTWFDSGGPGSAEGLLFPIENYLRISPSQTTTPTGSLRAGFQQNFEYQFCKWFFNTTMTYGFWYRTNKGGTYTFSVYINQTTPPVPQFILPVELIGDETWRFQVVDVPYAGGLALSSNPTDNADIGGGFSLILTQGPDSTGVAPEGEFYNNNPINGTGVKSVAGQVNFFDSVSNYLDLTGFRLFPKAFISSPELMWQVPPKPFDEELRRCQRWYQKSYRVEDEPGTVTTVGSIGWDSNGSRVYGTVNLPVELRATGTRTIYNPITGAPGSGNDDGVARPAAFVSGHFKTLSTQFVIGDDVSFHYTIDTEI